MTNTDNTGWVSVARALPVIPEDKLAEGFIQRQVLVFCKGETQCAWYQPDVNCFADIAGWLGKRLDSVTHWRYLPEPPMEMET